MKKVFLITPLAKNFPADPKADYIGIDAGYLKILEAGLPCRMALGDFDSLEQALPADLPLEIHPVRKDETDTQLALEWAVKNGYTDIVVWGGLEGRLDHTLANIRLMVWQYPQMVLEDENQKAFVMLPGSFSLRPEWKHVSFFAMEPSCFSLENLEYEACGLVCNAREMFTVSNGFKNKNPGKVHVRSGRVLCILTNFR